MFEIQNLTVVHAQAHAQNRHVHNTRIPSINAHKYSQNYKLCNIQRTQN